MSKTLLALVLAGSPALAQVKPSPTAPPPIPARPEALVFQPIHYDPPRAEEFRTVLKNGMVAFVAEDKALPLVNITLLMRVGGYLDPRGKEGLAAMTGAQMRRGGTKSLAPEALDEKLDFLATAVNVSIGDTSGSASMNCLRENLDESLKLLVEILKEPRFDPDRLSLARDAAIQEMKRRNDDAGAIEGREWRVLLRGENHFTNRFTTEASLKSLSQADLVAFRKAFVHPALMVAAVSGAFDKAEIVQKLEAAFADWPEPRPTVEKVPDTIEPAPPGLYKIEKDVNQGRVSIGLPLVKRDSPDIYALEVMNELLGGAGFTSRITRTVRSNEGLAYQAGSAVDFGIYYPGAFRALFQSKSESVSYATSLVYSEIEKIRTTLPTAQELDTIKKSLIETFPSEFASRAQSMSTFAADEFTGRSPEYWRTYRARIQAVTGEDVRRVAQQYLLPEQMRVLVVGNQKAIAAGDGRHKVALSDVVKGPETTLPLRDPMTMKRP
jgi:predicted Zn-dependent peptidase